MLRLAEGVLLGAECLQCRQALWSCARAYSSAWLERTPDKREVGSSILPRPTSIVLQMEA